MTRPHPSHPPARHVAGLAALAAVLALLSPGEAEAEFRAVEEAYELTLQQVRLSTLSGDRGVLVVQNCPACARSRLGLTGKTQWRVGPRGNPLLTAAEFRTQYQKALAGNRQSMVFVYFDPGTGVVNRVVLSVQGAGTQGAGDTP